MYKILTSIILCLGLNSQAQFYYYPFPPSTTSYKIIEKAGVKICHEYRLLDDVKILSNILEYGAKGLPAALYEKDTDLNGDSITSEETIYKYNAALKLSLETIEDMEFNDITTVSYSYDTKGRLLKKIIITPDPTTYKYSYDAAGRISKATSTIKMPEVDKDGEPTGKAFEKPSSLSVFKYDSKNRLQEEWYYYADMGPIDMTQPIYKYKWEYNSNNQISKIYNIDVDGDITQIQDLLYNDKSLLIKRTVNVISEKKITEFIYEYCMDCKQSWMK